jgi:hypothetical protein
MVLQYVSSTAQSAPSMAPCPLHGFCPFCGPLSPLQPSVLSSALQYVPCKAFLFPLRCSVSSTDLITLYGPVPTLQPSILSKALFPLQPSIPSWYSVLSMALCPLYSPLSSESRNFPHIITVRYHCGGWPEEVNTCFLNSYMVYL